MESAEGTVPEENTNDRADEQGAASQNPVDSEELHQLMRAPKITTLAACSVVIAVVLVIAAIGVIVRLIGATSDSENVHARYNECENASSELMVASDYLTTQCRMFVVTGDRRFMDAYFEELLVTKRRDNSVAILEAEGGDERAAAKLVAALGESNELSALELYAMKLVCEAVEIDPVPVEIAAVQLKEEDEALSDSGKRSLAESMVLGDTYREMKEIISNNVDDCAAELVRGLENKVLSMEHSTDRLLFGLVVIAVLLMLLVAVIAAANYVLLTRPMKIHEKDLHEGKPFEVIGSAEIRRVAVAYNELLAASRARTERLRHDAETDALTGVLNRGTYDHLLETLEDDYALILVDVDHFKEVNDQHGHEIGDEVLKWVASTIDGKFRSSDYVCRIGGDEFAVIVTKAGPDSRSAIEAKLNAIAADIARTPEGLPPVTLSFGVAFSDGAEDANLYHNADKALYGSKRGGRDRAMFFGD